MNTVQSNISVVILSRSDDNVRLAVESVRRHEPDVPIIVVDDGLHPLTWRLLGKLGVRRIVPVERWTEQSDVGGAFYTLLPRTVEFVFARNANIGLAAAFSTGSLAAVLMNDDCELQSPGGFSLLFERTLEYSNIGLISAAFDVATIPQQSYAPIGDPVIFVRQLMFPCVLVPKHTFDLVGPLDESFIHYGFDDNDYCDRVKASGLELAVDHRCYVTHSGVSSYRSRPNWRALMAANQLIYERKKAQSNV